MNWLKYEKKPSELVYAFMAFVFCMALLFTADSATSAESAQPAPVVKEATVTVAPSTTPSEIKVLLVEQSPAEDVPVSTFAGQVLEAISKFGGLSWVARIALLVTLLIGSMKVLPIRQYIWDKLGGAKAWAGPLLGAILGLLQLSMSNQLTLAGVLAWVSAGAGAIILHELLDSIKKLPGIGSVWVSFIEVVMKYLGTVKPAK